MLAGSRMSKVVWRASANAPHSAVATHGADFIMLAYTGFGRYEIRINGATIESVEGLELAKRRAIRALTK